MRRAHQLNRFDGLAITKLDVLDGLETLKICTGYRIGDETVEDSCSNAAKLYQCAPVYEELPGWSESTQGITGFDQLPDAAKAYLARISEVTGVPINLISTGPDRGDEICLKPLFD